MNPSMAMMMSNHNFWQQVFDLITKLLLIKDDRGQLVCVPLGVNDIFRNK